MRTPSVRLLTSEEAGVLEHTLRTGCYVTGEAQVLALAKEGLLQDHGPQRLAAGDHYFTMTAVGREAMKAWRAVQPKPPRSKRRRRSAPFESWMAYREAGYRVSFSAFLRDVWPNRRAWA